MNYDIIKKAVIQQGHEEDYGIVAVNLPEIRVKDNVPALGRTFIATRIMFDPRGNAVKCRLTTGGTVEFWRWYMLPEESKREIAKFLGVIKKED